MGMNMVPTRLFFTKGVGKHKERLTSFELALRDAGIAAQNLVRVSSIFPPQCKLIPRKEGLKYLNPGEVVFAVIAENSTREAHRLVVSSIGVAIPTDRNTYGYLSEHHSFGAHLVKGVVSANHGVFGLRLIRLIKLKESVADE